MQGYSNIISQVRNVATTRLSVFTTRTFSSSLSKLKISRFSKLERLVKIQGSKMDHLQQRVRLLEDEQRRLSKSYNKLTTEHQLLSQKFEVKVDGLPYKK